VEKDILSPVDILRVSGGSFPEKAEGSEALLSRRGLIESPFSILL